MALPLPIMRRAIDEPYTFVEMHGIQSYIEHTYSSSDTVASNLIRLRELMLDPKFVSANNIYEVNRLREAK